MCEKVKSSIKPFDGLKYNIWRSRVRALIDETILDEDAFLIIDQPNRPNNVSESKWLRRNKIAKGIIIRNLSDSIVGCATNNPTLTAHQIFLILDNLYMRQSLATELSTEMKLLKFKHDNNMSLTEHFMLYDELIGELETASGCKLKDTNKIARLLSSLPKTYDPLVVAIQTLSDDKLSLSFVKVRLLEHEIHLKSEANDTSLKVLQAVEYNKTHTNKPFKRNFVKNNKKTNYKNKIKCHFCNKIGHIKKNCYKYINNQNKNQFNNNANMVQRAETNSSGFIYMCDQNLSASKGLMFIIDSGASDHIINDEKLFYCCEELNPPLRIAVAKSGTFIEATKRGQVKLLTDKNILLILKDVLFCKEVPSNLMSVKKMQEADFYIIFSKNNLIVKKDDKVLFQCNTVNSLVKVNLYKEVNYVSNVEYLLWHSRLGHISRDRFNEIKNKNLFIDSQRLKHIKPNDDVCEPCIIGKQGRLKYQKAKDKSYVQRPLFIIHTDVCGPISPPTFDDNNYFVVYVDEYTHYCCTYIIRRKSDVFETFQDFNAKASAHFNSRIVHLYSDNGTEYLSNDMKTYCKKNGISYHLTVPHSPELNGVSERMIRSLTEKSRVLIHEAKLEKTFWGEAVKTATYLNNISPSKAVRFSKTPFEMWHNRKPRLQYLRKFGSTMFVHCKVRKAKFDEKAWKGILVGYDPNGYRIWNVETGKIIVARDVTVDEKSYNITRPDLQLNKVHEGNDVVSESMTHVTDINESDVNESNGIPLKRLICEPDVSESMTKMSRGVDMRSSMEVEEDNVIENTGEQLRRSNRIKELPKKSYNELLMCSLEFISDIPKCYNDIKGRNDEHFWREAIDQEMSALYENNTWTIVQNPLNKNIIGCRWVFTIKNDGFGNATKYKARLVAQGFSQKYLEDYEETFAPVARITSLRFLIAFANQFDLLIHQLDVRTAFLNGMLKQEIYMRIPEGVKSNENEVCKLNKALYGLKQAARCWFETFENVLLEKGFKNSEVDRCIYVLNRGDINNNVYVILYVDDILIITAKMENMNEFKNYLKHRFKMTDLNEIQLFLGIKFEKEINKITLDQSSYIENVLKKFNMSDCKPVTTPLLAGIDFNELNKDEETDFPCRNLIGCLMYIMLCTRPDLSIAVNIVSRFSNKRNKTLWIYLKRILRYLKGTINIKLIYTKSDFNSILCGYVDSDWGGDDLDKRSTTGFLFKLFNLNTISWNTRKQTSVAASSTEAEYMALFEAVRELLWLKSLSESIGLNVPGPIVLYEDNQGCIAIAKNPTSHKRSKHINIKYHFTREQVEKEIVRLEYIPTDKQLADMLTKPLSTGKFEESRSNIGLNF